VGDLRVHLGKVVRGPPGAGGREVRSARSWSKGNYHSRGCDVDDGTDDGGYSPSTDPTGLIVRITIRVAEDEVTEG